jgi:DNA polymerase-3 subunit gamma/tau
MSYTVLARRYRSTTFDEVIGQDHVARTLKRAIESGRVAHAYLFCGTRGVGKTSMARILAKALNCESFPAPTATPCGTCSSCQGIARGEDIDVIEIDAASNRGIDDVRNIIANAAYRPARARFKIYIIDEVHGLTKDAFNALLKVLEEPPEHVKFILATTEAEKVLPTILSRCQRYDFRNIPTREIAAHLKEITARENLDADEDALLLVAKAGAGSMRDSLSLLDRLLSVGEKRLTAEMIEQLLGLPRAQLLFDLAQAIGEGNTGSVLEQAGAIVNGGMSVDSLIAALSDHLRNLLILKTCGPASDLVEVAGVAPADMAQQAERFDAVALAQDIPILEELRRHIRQSQAGRALLDATLVRLSLADQFASIGELLARLDGSGPSARPAPNRPAGAGVAPKLPVQSPAQAPAQKKKTDELAQGASVRGQESIAVAPVGYTAPAGPPASAGGIPVTNVVAVAPPSPGAAPTVSAPPDFSFDDDDGNDDDLPRPGKVWEAGPSLKELMAAQASASRPAEPAAAPSGPAASNVEAVSARDLPRVWQLLLTEIAQHGPMLQSIVAPGRLVAVDGGTAVVRYGAGDATFVKMLERNGKKDLVRDALTKVLNEPVGLRFEIDAAAEAAATPAAPPPSAAAKARPAAPAAPPPRAAPPEPAGPPPVKLTPELIESLREAEPLVKTLMDDLGATIVKVEGEI